MSLTGSRTWQGKPRYRRLFEPLAAVGRTALTNYLLQSLIATSLFYGYGLGLYAVWGPAADLPLAAVIFAAEMALSVWWLRRFRFGPLEWLWRSLTYRRWQPFKIAIESQYTRAIPCCLDGWSVSREDQCGFVLFPPLKMLDG